MSPCVGWPGCISIWNTGKEILGYYVPFLLSGCVLSSCYTIPHLCRSLSEVLSAPLSVSVRPQQEPCRWTLSARVHLRVRRRRSSPSDAQRATQTCLLNTGRYRNWSSTWRYANWIFFGSLTKRWCVHRIVTASGGRGNLQETIKCRLFSCHPDKNFNAVSSLCSTFKPL